MTDLDLATVLRAAAKGERVEMPEKQAILQWLAGVFRKPVREADCPDCFMLRLLEEIRTKEEVPT